MSADEKLKIATDAVKTAIKELVDIEKAEGHQNWTDDYKDDVVDAYNKLNEVDNALTNIARW